jgi:RNA polymerase sigma factor (sigma-70 family)
MSPRLSEVFLRSQSDERLVGLARAGQDRAFAAIVQRYRPELLALAHRLTSDGRAEDLIQQAFMSAFAALRSGAEVRHLRGWLYQIVRNAATRAKPPAELALEQVDVASEPLEETVLRRTRALAAMSELARLPERQRGALVATALGDTAHAEVALSMGISEQAVRQLVHRARATLRGAVTGITPWPLARWLATAPRAATGPEIAVSAGAVSSTGVAVKLGVLLAATGALATGVAVGPPRQVHHQGVGQSASPRAPHATARAVAPILRAGSVGVAGVPPARRTAPATRPSTRNTSRALAAPSRSIRGFGLTAVTTTNLGGTTVEDLTAERRGDASAPERQATESSENGHRSGADSSEGAGSAGHDGHAGSGSNGRAGSDRDGSRSGTDGSSNPGPGGGDFVTSHDDAPAQGDGGDAGTPAAPTGSLPGSSAAGDGSGGGASSDDGGDGGQSGSVSGSSFSNPSTEGK